MIHFIAVGGSAMHNLAIALKKKGYEISGSDDEIFEPSRSRLASYGILPADEGWHPERLTGEIDAVILGMHARGDNPELLRALEMSLPVFSYPEYLYEQSKYKRRIVIGGSHGKTTITSMIMHVLKEQGILFDYMVGAQIEGFEVMVSLSEEAQLMIFEGDEYLTSPIDLRPKFHLYKPHVAVISGIAWDHINVFPTFEKYVEQFRIFIDLIEPGGTLIYDDHDVEVRKVAIAARDDIHRIPYLLPDHFVTEGKTYLKDNGGFIELKVFGEHNLLNVNAAKSVCRAIGIPDEMFYQAIRTFKGASKRLERVAESGTTAIYKDFAHSPSKLKATVQAMKQQYSERKLVACLELHTYSSLNSDFLPLYEGCMASADIAVVYYNPHTVELKRLSYISPDDIKAAFKATNLEVFTDSRAMVEFLSKMKWEHTNLLMMSSGNFDGIDFRNLAAEILTK